VVVEGDRVRPLVSACHLIIILLKVNNQGALGGWVGRIACEVGFNKLSESLETA
jgi:hypothetical protein